MLKPLKNTSHNNSAFFFGKYFFIFPTTFYKVLKCTTRRVFDCQNYVINELFCMDKTDNVFMRRQILKAFDFVTHTFYSTAMTRVDNLIKSFEMCYLL